MCKNNRQKNQKDKKTGKIFVRILCKLRALRSTGFESREALPILGCFRLPCPCGFSTVAVGAEG
jgi:hypothetical protein